MTEWHETSGLKDLEGVDPESLGDFADIIAVLMVALVSFASGALTVYALMKLTAMGAL